MPRVSASVHIMSTMTIESEAEAAKADPAVHAPGAVSAGHAGGLSVWPLAVIILGTLTSLGWAAFLAFALGHAIGFW
jgi:hypothetical protein